MQARRAPPPETWDDAASNFEKEAHDAAWTDNMQSYLASLAFLSDAGIDPIRNVDCRESTCRITANLAQLSNLQRGQQSAMDDGFGYFVKLNPADGTATAFVTEDPARPGGQ